MDGMLFRAVINNMQMGKKLSWCFAAVLFLCGCQHDPYADWFVTKSIPDNTLLGSYHITAETLEHFARADLPSLQGHRLPLSRDAKIVLAADHKISVSQVAIDWLDAQRHHVCVLNSTGTWKVAKHQEFTAVNVTLEHLQSPGQGCPDRGLGFGLELFDDSIMPWHSAAKYPLLHLSIGDPDSGDALQFEKD